MIINCQAKDIRIQEEFSQLVFNTEALPRAQHLLQAILDSYMQINLLPNISSWQILLNEQNITIKESFSTRLCNFYIEITENSQIFGQPIFVQILKSMHLLIAILSQDKNISTLVCNSKCLRSIYRMLRLQESEELLLCLCILTQNHRNCEYLTIKNAPQFLTQQYSTKNRYYEIIIGNMCYSNNQRLLFWCQGLTSHIKQPTTLGSIYLMWRLVYDAVEVAQDFTALNFKALYINLQFNEETGFIVGLLRKMCELNEQFKIQHQEQILLRLEQLLNAYPPLHQILVQFTYKEMFSFIGLVGINESMSRFAPKIIKAVWHYFKDPKMVTTGIGALSNLATIPDVIENIHLNPDFMNMIQEILLTYIDRNQLIEYTLKLLVNTVTNKNIAQMLIQKMKSLIIIWCKSVQYVQITNVIIRILRSLYVYEKYSLEQIYQLVDNESLMNMISQNLEQNLNTGNLDSAKQNIIFVSLLPRLTLSKEFQQLIRLYLEMSKANLKEALQVVSFLPIEDFIQL